MEIFEERLPPRGEIRCDYLREHITNDKTNKIRRHPCAEIMVIVRGDVIFTTGGKVVRLGDGSVIYNPKWQIHQPFVQYGHLYERYRIFFYPEDLPSDICKSDGLGDMISCSFAKSLSEVDFASILMHAQSISRLTKADTLAVRMIFFELALLLFKAATSTPEKRERNEGYITEVAAYINEHYGEKLTIERLAERFFVSKGKLIYDFRSYSKLRINEYITVCRIERAKEKLSLGLSVSAVAEECGFSSPSYFIKVFSDLVGTTPLKYQINNCNISK